MFYRNISDVSFFFESEVARGSGWQRIGAYVNLGAYYLVGIPVAATFGFGLHLRGKGLWIGIIAGSSVQAILLAIITFFTNWQKQVSQFLLLLEIKILLCYLTYPGKQMEVDLIL